VDEYLAFGVRYVWILDPRTRRAQIYDPGGVHEVKGGMLWTSTRKSWSRSINYLTESVARFLEIHRR